MRDPSPLEDIQQRTLDSNYSIMEHVIQTMYDDASGNEAAGWYSNALFHRDSFFAGPPFFRPVQEVLGYPANNGANEDMPTIDIV